MPGRALDLTSCQSSEATCQGDLIACQNQPAGGLPATGQTTAYGLGSDGDVQAGAALSYTDNLDGTVTDNNTGLMWEKKDDSGGIHDKDTVYTWLLGSPYNMDGTITTKFLATLNGGGGFAGHTDWRIPNFRELSSIADFQAANPVVSPEFHHAATCTGCTDVTAGTCSCTTNNTYWSSTTRANASAQAFAMFFNAGDITLRSKTGSGRVRAVRGGV